MRTLDQILTKRITAGKLRPLCFIRTARCGKTADHRLRGLFGRCRAGRVETNQQRSGRPSQSHLSGGDRAGNAVHPVLPGRKASPGVMEAYPALYVPDGGAVFLVDGHLDRKLCRSVFHDPKLLQDRVPEYCHPHCRGAGLSVREKPSSCLPSASALPTRPSCC